MSISEFPRVVWEFIAATNAQDLQWLESLFTARCTISACGYCADGLTAVAHWMETEVVSPSLFLTLDGVRCDGAETTLRVSAEDHGIVHESDFTFRTEGRYIQSLTIAAIT